MNPTTALANRRLDAARARMAAEGVDLLALPPGDDLRFLFSYTTHVDERPCFLFLAQDAGLFVVPELNAAEAAPHMPLPALAYSDASGPTAALGEARARLGRPGRIAVGDTMRADALLLLQGTWPDARYVPGAGIMATLRMIKSPEEIEALRRAAASADQAVHTAWSRCRRGMRETDLARVVHDAFGEQGAGDVMAIIGSGPNSAFPHHHSGSRALQAGEPVLADIGARLDGYMSDITRMAYLGEPPARYREIHRIVDEAVAAALAVIRPGVLIRVVDAAARGVIERAGHGPHFIHRTGHGIGLTGHEPPSITHTNDLPLAEGMAFSVEPGIYLVGEFGVRLEEIVVVTATGAEVLSHLPREVWIIESELATGP